MGLIAHAGRYLGGGGRQSGIAEEGGGGPNKMGPDFFEVTLYLQIYSELYVFCRLNISSSCLASYCL